MTMKHLIWALALLAPLAPAGAADSVHGASLAARWCVSCHVPGPGMRSGPTTDAGPPFATIAADPALTEQRLRGWLAAPHPPMPNLNLTRAEIEDLIAYIRGLKPR